MSLKECTVSMVGQDGQAHEAAVEAASLFDAAALALEQWSRDAVEALTGIEPALPDELSDRAQDAWEPLIAIAELVATNSV